MAHRSAAARAALVVLSLFGFGTGTASAGVDMELDHFSTGWDNAPMPNSIFSICQEGHAIHGSPSTRRRAVSHGCVRLAPGDAATLYSLVGQQGMGKTKIVILDSGIADASGIH